MAVGILNKHSSSNFQFHLLVNLHNRWLPKTLHFVQNAMLTFSIVYGIIITERERNTTTQQKGFVAMNFLITFIVLSIINVIFSTIRSITTIKSGKTLASLISGGYFAFYNVMLIYTVANFPMWQKCLITFVCNVIGVWIVKYAEQKMQKDKLWKVEATVKPVEAHEIKTFCEANNIPFSYIDIDKYVIFNFYCATQKESALVKTVCDEHNAKYFVSESKNLT